MSATDAGQRLAADLVNMLQTPLFYGVDTEDRLFAHEAYGISSGEHRVCDIARSVQCIGSDADHIDDRWRLLVSLTLRRLAEVIEP